MNKMPRKSKVVGVLSLILVTTFLVLVSPFHSNDACDVYSEILAQYPHESGQKFILIEEESEPQSRFGLPSVDSAQLGLEASVRIDFFFANLFRWKLPHEIRSAAVVQFVSASDLSSVMIGAAQGKAELQRMYSESGGSFTFSRVGFNLRRSRAVVYVQYLCALCGEGFYALLEKHNGKWNVIGHVSTWVS
jgi:hypothetical protein